MDEASKIDGTYQTIGFKNVLRDAGLPGTFFAVACHIAGQGYPISGTSQCLSLGDVPFSLLQEISNDGFLVGNHTFSHVPFSDLTDSVVVSEVREAQKVVNALGQTLGLNVLRCPGLDCGGNVTVLNTQPDLKILKGPINADVGGGFYTDNIQPVPGYPAGSSVGGDWWFYLNNLPPELAGYYYVRDIVNFGSKYGVIVLFHTRSDVMIGWDGNRQFPVKLIQYVLANLPPGFTFAPIDGIPGLLGNVQTTMPELISTEFGANDGQGRIVSGNLTSNAAEMDLCKARNGSVYCKLWKQVPARVSGVADSFPNVVQTQPAFELQPSSSWLDVDDPDWTAKFGSRFWLVDLNNDGKKDFVQPSQAGLLVGYSNGVNGFASPVTLLAATNLDYRGVRFADVNGDGLPDLIAWTPSAVLTYINNGQGGFGLPIVASQDFPAANGWNSDLYLSAMQVADVSYDGCPDLLMRGPTDVMVGLGDCQGHFLTATSWTKRFSDAQNFSLPSQNLTFSVAKVAGYTGLAAGLFTGGIVFQQANPSGLFGQYRYIMDNQNFSGDPGFHSEVYASDVTFVDLYNDGNTVPVQMRPNGLYASHIKIVNQ